MDIQEVTGVALVFLRRVQITGEEADVMVELKKWLLGIQQGEIVPVIKDDLQHLIDRDATFTELQTAEKSVGKAEMGAKDPEPEKEKWATPHTNGANADPVESRKEQKERRRIERASLEKESIKDTPDG